MSITNFPQGASSFGYPMVNPLASLPEGGGALANASKTGTVWFVDSTAGVGADGNDGLSPATALKTIGRALTLANSNTGDTIYVFKGSSADTAGAYAENLVVTKDSITIISAFKAGNGKRTTVSPATGVPLLVKAPRFRAIGIRFAAQDASNGATLQGDGFEFIDCDFTSTSGTGCLVQPFDAGNNTGSQGRFTYCLFRESGTIGLTFESGAAGTAGAGLQVTNVNIEHCQFYGNTNEDMKAVKASGGDPGVYTFLSMRGCEHMDNKHGSPYLTLSAGANDNGIIEGGYFGDRTGLSATEIALPSGHKTLFAGNFQPAGVVNGSAF